MKLEDYLADAAKGVKPNIAFETHPEAGYYYRSDHFNFAKIGVPALYTSSGNEVIGRIKATARRKTKSIQPSNYHSSFR